MVFTCCGSIRLLAIPETEVGDEIKAVRRNFSRHPEGFDADFRDNSEERVGGALQTILQQLPVLYRLGRSLDINNGLHFVSRFPLDRLCTGSLTPAFGGTNNVPLLLLLLLL